MNLRLPTFSGVRNGIMNGRSSMLSMLLAVLAIFSFSTEANAQCEALFAPNYDAQHVATIHFENQSTFSATQQVDYSWAFGDGGSSSDHNPSHTYMSIGSYQVCLNITAVDTIAGDTCYNSACDNVMIENIETPCGAQAYISPAAQLGCSVATVTLDASGSSVGVNYSYNWTTPGGNIVANSNTLNPIVDSPGQYTLTVTDVTAGCSSTAMVNVIQASEMYINVDTVAYTCPGTATGYASISALGGTHPYTYGWNDAAMSTSSTVTNLSEGSYIATIVDANGCQATTEVVVNAFNAEFSFNETGEANTFFFQEHAMIDHPATYTWSMNGQVFNTSNVTYTFPDSGSYEVCLEVIGDAGCALTKCTDVQVMSADSVAGCHASFYYDVDTDDHKKYYFQNQSTSDTPMSYQWDFGNGMTSTEANPVVQYTGGGDYEVCLIVIGNDDCRDTLCTNINVAEHSPAGDCHAQFYFDHDSSDYKTLVFQDQSYTSNGYPITEWMWDFGDESGAPDQSPTHIFPHDGHFNVCLTIATEDNCSNTLCTEVNIQHPDSVHEENPCHAQFSHYTMEDEPNKIAFNNYSSAPEPVVYTWNFGDENFSNDMNPQHVYADTGYYQVCLQVDGADGCSNNYCEYVYVNEHDSTGGDVTCNVDFSFDINPDDYRTVVFNNYSHAQDPAFYEWTVDGTTFSNDRDPQLTLPDTGQFEICLRVVGNDACESNFCHYVHIYDHNGTGGDNGAGTGDCYANFSPSIDSLNWRSVSFSNHSGNSAGEGSFTYFWDFGDNNTSTEMEPNHHYAQEGQYNVCLTVTGDDGCSNMACGMMHVYPNQGDCDISAEFAFNRDSINSLMYHFESYAMTSDSIVAYDWNFGDGTSSTEMNPSHQFAAAGNYNVCFKVVSENGCVKDHCLNISVNSSSCVANFGGFMDTTAAPFTIQFDNLSQTASGTMATYLWEFGDGDTSTMMNPSHTFSAQDNYNICLTVFDGNGCQFTHCQEVDLRDNNCQTAFYFEQDDTNDLTVKFHDQTNQYADVVAWLWEFGDGSTSDVDNPGHTYNNYGFYTVCLETRTSEGCVSQTCLDINVQPLDTNITIPDGQCFANFFFEHDTMDFKTIAFHDNSENSSGAISSWTWTFGDNTTATGPNVTHQFPAEGEYEVCLTTVGVDGCQATHCMMVHIVPHDELPECFASFTFINAADNGYGIQFFASGSSNINGGYWDFGDGNTSHEKDPFHHYSEPGYYDVCITAWDSLTGCQVRHCEPIQVGDPNQGTNNCYVDFELRLLDKTVVINDLSSSNINGWFYDFGNGATTNEQNPNYTYEMGGFYTVCLTAFDSLTGCQQSLCKSFEIYDSTMTNCNAEFTFIPSTVDSKEIQFSNTSNGSYTNSHWSFGHNGYSDDENPNHYFENGGFNEVCLTIWDSLSGCQDNFCMPIDLGADSLGNVDCFAEFSVYVHPNGEAVLRNESQGAFTNSHWYFTDGSISNEEHVSHFFTQGGYQGACLTIWDTISGCQAEICHDFLVEDTTTVVNSCKAEFTYFTDAAGEYHFDNISVSTGDLTDQHWNFGDGMFSNIDDPIHFFSTYGEFEVCLTVRDSVSGCMDTYCEWIHRIDTTSGNDDFCIADFTFVPVAGSMEVVFDNQARGNFTEVRWEFGDGTVSHDYSASHNYTAPGFYNVCLGVRDTLTNCMDHFCRTIQVGDVNNDSSFADCHAEFSYFTEPDGSVHFENLSQGAFNDQHWSFGDMEFSTMYSPSHLYDANREYEVCLKIHDTISGCIDEICMPIVVQDFADSNYVHCEAHFNYFFEDDSTVAFNNESVGTFTETKWYFGNNSFSDDFQPIKSFDNAGYYDVCLMVRDSISGCMAEVCQSIHIDGPAVDSTVMITNCYADYSYFYETESTLNFQAHVSDNITDVLWFFGDGSAPSTDLTATHDFLPGHYYVKLLARDSVSGCVDEFYQDVFIQDTETEQVFCNAEFEMFPDANGLVFFENVSAGNFTDVKWEFSDGATSYDWNSDHYFTQFGVQGACLTVRDSISGCMDTYCSEIYVEDTTQNVVDCHAAFEMFPISETAVDFQNISTGTYTDFYWSFPGGEAGYTNHATIDFNQTGVIEACLTVRDEVSGCMDTYCETIELIGQEETFCNADFEYFVQDDMVFFEAISMGTVTDVMWDFDNGFNSNEIYPTHEFEPGYYEVKLIVRDSVSGCMASTSKGVNIESEEVEFIPCEAEFGMYVEQDTTIVHFSDFSTGGANTWYWSFGDNSVSSSEQNPSHIYETDGYYEVCLTIATDNGCQESFCRVIAVGDVSNSCYADFDYYADAVTSTAHFNNVSLGNLDYYEWSFGDNSSSNQYAPSHTYADTGYYATCLTVRNTAAGCEATKCEDIRVGNALENKCLFNCVWPGDANNDDEANHYDLLAIGFNYGLTGPARDSSSILWMGHEATNWSTEQWTGVNNRHGDCNGDGVINEDDVEAIQTNFAFSHPSQPYKAGEELTLEIVNPDLAEGEDMIISVKAGEASEVSMYGIGFEIGLDPEKFDFSSLSVDYTNSWLGAEASDMITVSHAEENLGKLFVALSRTDHIEKAGQGEIARLSIAAIGIDEEGTEVALSTSGGMDASGDTIPFVSGDAETIIISSIEDQEFVQKDISVYPNPTNGQINFNLPVESGSFMIRVYDQIANLVYSENQSAGGNVSLNLDHISSGIYMLEVTHENVQYIERFNMLK